LDIVTFVGTFHILSDIYITYLLIIIYDKDIESYIIYAKKRVMYKDFLSGMNTYPHTEDQATYYFPKHVLVTCKGTQLITLNLDLYGDNDSPFNIC
jgi:hypothetical protein